MVTSLTAMLVMMADISNMASFYVVVAVFGLMFLFILRRIGQDLLDPQPAVSHVHHVPPQTTMSKVGVPFTFALMEGGGDSYSQLGVRTSSQVRQNQIIGKTNPTVTTSSAPISMIQFLMLLILIYIF